MLPASKAHAFPLHHSGRKPCWKPGKDGHGPQWEEAGVWKSPEVLLTRKYRLKVPHHWIAPTSLSSLAPRWHPEHAFKHTRTSMPLRYVTLTHHSLKLKATLRYSPGEPSSSCKFTDGHQHTEPQRADTSLGSGTWANLASHKVPGRPDTNHGLPWWLTFFICEIGVINTLPISQWCVRIQGKIIGVEALWKQREMLWMEGALKTTRYK